MYEISDNSEVKENFSPAVEETKVIVKRHKSLKPKPIFIREIEDVVEFTYKLEKDCDPNSVPAISGRWIKVFPNSFSSKETIVEFLKEQKIPFYASPHLEAPLKVDIRGLPKSTQIEKKSKNSLPKKNSIVLKLFNWLAVRTKGFSHSSPCIC